MLKNLLLLSGFSTFVVIVIIGLDVYHNYTMSTLPSSTKNKVISIPPNFDKETLEALKKRTPLQVNLDEKSSIVSDDTKDTTTTPTPTITTTPSVSTSAGTLISPAP